MGLMGSSNSAAAEMAGMLIWMFMTVIMLPFQIVRVSYLMLKRYIKGTCESCCATLPWSGPCRGKYHKEPPCRICGATTSPCDAGLHG